MSKIKQEVETRCELAQGPDKKGRQNFSRKEALPKPKRAPKAKKEEEAPVEETEVKEETIEE